LQTTRICQVLTYTQTLDVPANNDAPDEDNLDNHVIVVIFYDHLGFFRMNKSSLEVPILQEAETVIKFDGRIWDCALSPDQKQLYVLHESDREQLVKVVDLTTMTVEDGCILVGKQDEPCLSISNNYVAVSSKYSHHTLIYHRKYRCQLPKINAYGTTKFRPGDEEICVSHSSKWLKVWQSRQRARLAN